MLPDLTKTKLFKSPGIWSAQAENLWN